MSTAVFKVTGMHCSSCSMLVTMNVEELAGVSKVECDHATGRTVITFDPSRLSVAALSGAIADAGYTAELVG